MTDLQHGLESLKTRFLERCRADLPLLEAAAAAPDTADRETLRFCVHRLAGAAGTFGYGPLGRAAGDVDDELVLGRTPTRAQLARLVALIRTEL